jgi:hypothetical protein
MISAMSVSLPDCEILILPHQEELFNHKLRIVVVAPQHVAVRCKRDLVRRRWGPSYGARFRISGAPLHVALRPE